MSEVTPVRTIWLMPDYFWFPLWESGSKKYALEPGDLPLSPDLAAHLWHWAALFDAGLNMADPASSPPWPEEVERDFMEQGRRLTEQLQEELGPGFRIILRLPGWPAL